MILYTQVFLTSLLCIVITTTRSIHGYSLFNGVMVTPIRTDVDTTSSTSTTTTSSIDLGQWIHQSSLQQQQGTNQKERILIVFGTYAADFNAIEYGQRLRYYYPILQETKNITKCAFLLNCNMVAAQRLCQYIDLPSTMNTTTNLEVFIDPCGIAGRKFGVSRGWLPDNDSISPYLKLFGMLFGLGAYGTLPAVISGYIGNPFIKQPWITNAFIVGIEQNRWPNNIIEIIKNTTDNTILEIKNQFDTIPFIGKTWGRRPFELATLRLQSMLGISLQHWDILQPDAALQKYGILTQLGGCLILEKQHNDFKNNITYKVLYDWKDPGICAVANFEDILEKT
jgi:hypothetical protein